MRYALGLDIGTASVGWAAVEIDEKETPLQLLRMGARCFEAGVDGDIAGGRDSSRAVVRRTKRLMRRQLWRRARRRRKVLRLLQGAGLMAAGATKKPEECHELLLRMDEGLRAKWRREGEAVDEHTWVYRIRAAGVEGRVELMELGRAIYHLAHRRGFLSNRKTDRREKETGPVKEGIGELAAAMGERTLGQYFSMLNPEVDRRIRERWTARRMYEQEFDAIMREQCKHHVEVLTEEFVRRLRRAIFLQRPLKSSRGLIGMCDLEPGKRRALAALPIAQRFRMLQKVNDLAVFEPSGVKRALTAEERGKVIGALGEGDLTFKKVRKLLGMKESKKPKGSDERIEPGHVFNFEREGTEDKLVGNRTGAEIRKVLPRWEELGKERQDEIVLALCGADRAEVIEKMAREKWGMSEPEAKGLAGVHLEEGRSALSRAALEQMVPRMEEGLPYMTARQDEYPEKAGKAPMDRLPPVKDALRELKNPAVMRALTEVRKIVNGLVGLYGKPAVVRIELARDLKRSREDRKRISENQQKLRGEREKARKRILAEAKIAVGRAEEEKYMLAEECGWRCPYTGKAITLPSLFGPEAQFDVEHIIPLSVSLDNTFRNKTLCYHEENRHGKRNRTPFDAYAGDDQKWHEILARVKRFVGGAAAGKLEAFQMTPEQVQVRYSDFTERHLADTRYASRLAAEYVAMLYGGLWDGQGKRRVQAVSGGTTGALRMEWGYNGILNDGGVKTRSDHRHHAVDAAVIAMTSPGMVAALAKAAETAWQPGGRRAFARLAAPISVEEMRKRVGGIVVSHRCDHRIAGALHAETNYGRALPRVGGKGAHRVRERLETLGKGDVAEIVDKRIREIVEKSLNGGDPKVVFKRRENHPVLKTKDGRQIPIHKVRIWVDKKPRTVGHGPNARFVGSSTESNHHTVVVWEKLPSGERWEDHPVERLEVYRRKAAGKPLVQMEWGPGRGVAMWLCKGDMVEMDDGPRRSVYVVRGISKGYITIMPHNDARTGKEVKEAKEDAKFRIRTADALRTRHAKKVTITPLGEIVYVGN